MTGDRSATDPTLVVHDIGELIVGPASEAGGTSSLDSGAEVLDVRRDVAVVVSEERVLAVGPSEELTREYPPENADSAIDAAGRAVVPGFVDPHTHAIFAGDRSDEFEAKLRGKRYGEILADGGGILRTVRATRDASDERLRRNLRTHLDAMVARGTTTVEVKSGYGLEVETELRLLDAIDAVSTDHPADVVPTFMGAHAVPEGSDPDAYVTDVIDEQLPAVAEQGVAAFCDVFCEEGAFDVEQSRLVLEAGRNHGFEPKVHAEELSHIGGTRLASDIGAASADHLLHATAADARALAEAGTVPVFLPGTAFGLGAEYADAKLFLDAGCPVALATDFNPNCHSRSMAFTQTLACVEMGLTPATALLASTSNAARAIGLTDGTGTLTPGSPGDLLVLDAPSYRHISYRFDTSVVSRVVKGGSVVASDGRIRDTDSGVVHE